MTESEYAARHQCVVIMLRNIFRQYSRTVWAIYYSLMDAVYENIHT